MNATKIITLFALVAAFAVAGCGEADSGAAGKSSPPSLPSQPSLADVACASTTDPEDEKSCPQWAAECSAVSDTKRETFQCVRAVIANEEKKRNDEFQAQKAAEVDEFANSLTPENFDEKCAPFLGDNPPTEGNASAYIDACNVGLGDE